VITASDDKTANSYDNAVAKRFFWSLKYEWTNHRVDADLESNRQSVFNYIQLFYNQRHRHQTLAWSSPCDFETDFRKRIMKTAETKDKSTIETAF
jgi:putative transposase